MNGADNAAPPAAIPAAFSRRRRAGWTGLVTAVLSLLSLICSS
jgi:hypothetical protein